MYGYLFRYLSPTHAKLQNSHPNATKSPPNAKHMRLSSGNFNEYSHDLRRKLAPFPNTWSINIKQVRNRNQSHGEEPQYTTRPRNPQIMKHRIHKQREHRRKNAPQKRISSNRTC